MRVARKERRLKRFCQIRYIHMGIIRKTNEGSQYEATPKRIAT
jgi:hypothetical protein